MIGDPVPRPEWADPPEETTKVVSPTPKLWGEAFNCPNCGAFAQQTWNILRFSPPGIDLSLPSGVSGACCVVCNTSSYWLNEKMIYPPVAAGPLPAEGMPADVRACYDEARQVYPISPKSAGALLRLGLEKLLQSLGQTDGIDTAIGKLVKDGVIDEHTQQAMDVLRIIGNQAVHPGFIDLDEVPETASFMFELLNMIVVETVTKKQRVAKLWATLPADKRKGVEDRAKRIK